MGLFLNFSFVSFWMRQRALKLGAPENLQLPLDKRASKGEDVWVTRWPGPRNPILDISTRSSTNEASGHERITTFFKQWSGSYLYRGYVPLKGLPTANSALGPSCRPTEAIGAHGQSSWGSMSAVMGVFVEQRFDLNLAWRSTARQQQQRPF